MPLHDHAPEKKEDNLEVNLLHPVIQDQWRVNVITSRTYKPKLKT